MHKGRCVGLVGGIGVGAAIFYYRKLAEAHERSGVTMDLVMAHAEVPRVMEYVQAEDRDGLTSYLLGFLDRLQAAGAECAVLPSVTTHFSIRELVQRTRLPLFNIFDPLRKEIAARSLRRVALFGTRYVMNSGLYGMVPEVEIVPARAEETDIVHKTYMDLALHGKAGHEEHRELTAIAHTLCKRERVDAILLAGTDLTLLFNEANTDFPYVDCAAVHVRAVAEGLLSKQV
jgi:aspartate racemase